MKNPYLLSMLTLILRAASRHGISIPSMTKENVAKRLYEIACSNGSDSSMMGSCWKYFDQLIRNRDKVFGLSVEEAYDPGLNNFGSRSGIKSLCQNNCAHPNVGARVQKLKV